MKLIYQSSLKLIRTFKYLLFLKRMSQAHVLKVKWPRAMLCLITLKRHIPILRKLRKVISWNLEAKSWPSKDLSDRKMKKPKKRKICSRQLNLNSLQVKLHKTLLSIQDTISQMKLKEMVMASMNSDLLTRLQNSIQELTKLKLRKEPTLVRCWSLMKNPVLYMSTKIKDLRLRLRWMLLPLS